MHRAESRHAELRPSDHDDRLRAAEAVAGWHLGHRGWAGILVGAYLDPDAALENLKREKGES